MTVEHALLWMDGLFGSACALLGAERLVALRRRTLWALLNADLAVARGQFPSTGRYRQAKHTAQIVRCLGGLACFGASHLPPGWTAAILIVTAGALLYDRRLEHVGGDGADQQLRVVGVALAVTAASACIDRSAIRSGIFFLALQLLCCYGVAGMAKLAAPTWRNGEALRCIAASDAFGSRLMRRFLALHASAALVMSWAVMLFESLFPLSILHPCLAIGGLSLALAFHMAAAATMRLNSFLWVFPVSYPAFYCVACEISRLRSGRVH